MIEIVREKAKKMYQHGMPAAEVAEVLGISYLEARKWIKSPDFQDIRRLMRMRISHMKRILLDSFESMQAGELPEMSPSKILQYATAYEKLSEKKRHLACWYEAFESLTDTLLNDIEALKHTRAQNQALKQLQQLRTHMAQLLKRLAKTALDE